MRGERFYGGVLMKAGSLGGPREKVPVLCSPGWQLGRCHTLEKLGDGMGDDLGIMPFIPKKIKSCPPHRELHFLTWLENRWKKNPVLFSDGMEEAKRSWSSYLDREEDSFSLSYVDWWLKSNCYSGCVRGHLCGEVIPALDLLYFHPCNQCQLPRI